MHISSMSGMKYEFCINVFFRTSDSDRQKKAFVTEVQLFKILFGAFFNVFFFQNYFLEHEHSAQKSFKLLFLSSLP